MPVPQPIRTGDPAIDSAARLYRPLTDELGPEKVQHLCDAAALAAKASAAAGRSADDIASDTSAALLQAMRDLICAFNPATKRWEWWDPATNTWHGECP